jgi:hypothetical protein
VNRPARLSMMMTGLILLGSIVAPAAVSEEETPSRIEMAGRGRERMAYTAYALRLFELQLTFLETLPDGWFIDTPEFQEGKRELEQATGIAPGENFAEDARAWHAWYVEHRPDLSDHERTVLDPLFLRLQGTTPFLISREFRDVVRSVSSMSGLPASWEGEPGHERYSTWAAFNRDRGTWRTWFNEHHAELEWDEAAHAFRIGRGLGE